MSNLLMLKNVAACDCGLWLGLGLNTCAMCKISLNHKVIRGKWPKPLMVRARYLLLSSLSWCADINHTEFSLMVNGEPRQHGFSHDMITPVYELIAYISQIFTLQAGDIVLTGTPEGVAALKRGDKLVLSMVGQMFETEVV
jgi:hypothetical protein